MKSKNADSFLTSSLKCLLLNIAPPMTWHEHRITGFVMCVGQLDKRLLSISVSGKWKGLLRSKQTEDHFILMLNVAHFVIKHLFLMTTLVKPVFKRASPFSY